MGTRSTISMVLEDGSVISAYCQFDGYLHGMGRMLKQYYADPNLAEKLIRKGAFSSVERDLDSVSGWTESGKPWKCKRYSTLNSFIERHPLQEFNYLMMGSTWLVKQDGTGGPYLPYG